MADSAFPPFYISARLDQSVYASWEGFGSAAERGSSRAKKSIDSVSSSLRAQRQAYTQSGQQIQDIVISIQSQQRVSTVLAQQLPQLAYAMQGFGGTVGRVAAVLSGPWGAALLLAGIGVGTLAAKLIGGADAAKDNEEATKDLIKAIDELYIATNRSAQSTQAATQARIDDAKAKRQQAIDTRAAAVAQLELAKAVAEASLAQARRTRGDGEGGTGAAAGSFAAAGWKELQIADLEKTIKDMSDSIAKAESTIRLNRGKQIQQQIKESYDAAAAANGKYERELDKLNQQLSVGKITEDAYRAAIDRATVARDKAVDAAKKSGKSSSESSKAAKEAAAAQRELESMLKATRQAFDPLATAAATYAEQLERIATLAAKGQINPVQAGFYRLRAETANDNARREETKKQLSDGLRSAIEDPLPELARTIETDIGDAMRRAGEALGDGGADAIRAIADLIPGALGKQLRGIAQVVATGSGHAAPGTFDYGVQQAIEPLIGKLESIFGQRGSFSQTLGEAFGNSQIGALAGSLVNVLGGKSSGLGSSIGGALGGALGKEVFGKALGSFAGPLGSIAGGLLGGALGGAFSKVKWGRVDLTSGGFTTAGNNSGAKSNATNAGDNFMASLARIAEQFGGGTTDFGGISLGQRHGDWRVNTGGTSLKIKKGAVEFDDDAEGAIAFAIKTAIERGAITGIRASTQRLLQAGKDLDLAIQKATSFESVFTRLKEHLDPVGAAIDTLNKEFTSLRKIFEEAGASSQEFADLQKLYDLERADAIKEATDRTIGSLKAFLDQLRYQGDFGLSLRDRQKAALDAFNPLAADIAAGRTVDQDKFTEAAQSLLEIERQIYGSGNDYFARLKQITDLTAKTVADQENVIALAVKAANPVADAQAAAAPVVGALNGQTSALAALLQQIALNTGSTQEAIRELQASQDGVNRGLRYAGGNF